MNQQPDESQRATATPSQEGLRGVLIEIADAIHCKTTDEESNPLTNDEIKARIISNVQTGWREYNRERERRLSAEHATAPDRERVLEEAAQVVMDNQAFGCWLDSPQRVADKIRQLKPRPNGAPSPTPGAALAEHGE